jgi:hypothetical protein
VTDGADGSSCQRVPYKLPRILSPEFGGFFNLKDKKFLVRDEYPEKKTRSRSRGTTRNMGAFQAIIRVTHTTIFVVIDSSSPKWQEEVKGLSQKIKCNPRNQEVRGCLRGASEARARMRMAISSLYG